MTLVEPSPVAGPARTAVGGRAWLEHRLTAPPAEHAVVLGLLVAVVLPLAHAGGGRGAGALAWSVPLVLAALALTRPWLRLDTRALALVSAVSVAALVVLAGTGGGRAGAVAALSYGFAPACGVVVAAYARTAARRAAVAGVLCAGAVAQFAWALVPWWGGGDPSRPMVGTYDWHNQFAAALLAPALLGLALVLAGHRPWRSAGWVAAPLAVAGVVLSTSRATLALLVVGWLAVVVVCLLAAPDRAARGSVASRALVVSVVTVGLTFLLPGPPLFSTSVSPLGGAAVRVQAGETLGHNSVYRTQFMGEALAAFGTAPVTGAGYGRLAAASHGHVPARWAVSPLAHSGPLQALGEGGVVLALPLFALLGAVLAGLLRRLRGPTGLDGTDLPVVRAAVIAALLLGVHSLVDTDWTYPALAAQVAVVAGVALAVPVRVRPVPSRPRLAASCAGVLAVALAVGGAAAWGQPFHISAPQNVNDVHTTSGGGHS